MSNYKRHIDDIDGMLDDIRENFYNNSKQELIDMIMDNVYGDKAEDEDIKTDFENFLQGEIYE
jgi:hypothetical protein